MVAAARKKPVRRRRLRGGAAELAERIEEARERVRPLVPDIDEQALVTILRSLLVPFGSGKRFLRRRRDDGGSIF